MPRRPGRPSKLTPEVQSRLLDAIKIGNYLEVAATLAGIDRSTVYNWIAKGREAKSGEHREFFDALKEAEAFAENSAVSMVRRGGRDWVAQMTFLERRFRDRWGRPAPGAYGSAIDTPAPPPDPAAVTDEVITVPLVDRVSGILQALDRAGKLQVDDSGHATNGAGEPVPGPGGGSRTG